jgi:AraC-like DNA-binding protein
MLLIDAPTVISGTTRRPTCVLIWSTTDRNFSFSNTAGKLIYEGKAAIVAPDVERQLKTINSNIFSLNIEPGHHLFRPLRHLTCEKDLIPLDIQQFNQFSDHLRLNLKNKNFNAIDEITNEILSPLLQTKQQYRPRDERIDMVLPLLDKHSPPELSTLAKKLHLSKDRLSHLFTEEIGIPIRSYILWRRYRRALLALQSGEKLSNVAHQVGFYDQAQMTRTFQNLFGFAPSKLNRPEFIHISSVN